MIEYLSASGHWAKLNPAYKIGEWSFWGDTEFQKSKFRINNKVYTEYNEDLIKAYEQELIWMKLSK